MPQLRATQLVAVRQDKPCRWKALAGAAVAVQVDLIRLRISPTAELLAVAYVPPTMQLEPVGHDAAFSSTSGWVAASAGSGASWLVH